MEYKRPKPNDNLGKDRVLIFSREIDVKDPTTGVLLPRQVSFMEVKDSEPDGTVTIQLSMERFTQELATRQLDIIGLKHNCIRVAERLNEELRNFLLLYNKYKKLSTDQLFVDDFMGLRNYLSDIVNKDSELKYLDAISNNAKRKNFTKNFYYFIEDRNIYTHGNLHIRVNDMEVVITYIDKKNNRESSCIVNEMIIQSFFENFKYLRDVLSQLSARVYERMNIRNSAI